MKGKIDISTPKYPNTFTLVDEEDYGYLNQWKWHKTEQGYVTRHRWIDKKIKYICMHRLIMNTKKGEITDHINRNKLDNRKSNLRICTRSQNNLNRQGDRNTSSKYKGVHICKRPELKKKCYSYIDYRYKRIRLGYHYTEEAAAKAYNCAARILHGEFACENKLLS